MASPRILIVDDNLDHAQLAVEFLGLSGYPQVALAHHAADLWARLAEATYDVILLDHNLPDSSGLDVLTEITRRGYRVPVVMVTGRGDERVAAQAIQRGAIDYLVKGGDYLRMLPALVEKAVRTADLMRAAQRSLEKIRYQALLLDNVRDAVVVWDTEGRLTFWNRTAELLFGWRAEDCLAQPWADRYATLFDPPVQPADVDCERQFAAPDARRRWVSSTVTPLLDETGKHVGTMDISRDITTRKQLEAQIKRAQAQLAHATRLAAIGELASGVAHQISNPLTTIIAETQLLLRELETDHPAQDMAQAIQQAGWRAQHAVQQLLDFSRPPADTLEQLDLNATLERALALVGGHIRTHTIEVQTALAPNVPRLTGNARQLEDLWVNLLMLARDGAPKRIFVQSALCGSQVQVSIADDGNLIPADQLTAMLEPDFVGFDSPRGAGLELSICREIARQHRAELHVTSARHSGTVFAVNFFVENHHEPD